MFDVRCSMFAKSLAVSLLSLFLFTGCNENSSQVDTGNSLSLQERTSLERDLKSSSENRLSYKFTNITDSKIKIKLPFQIVSPLTIEFFNSENSKVNINTIVFTEDDWNSYQTVEFANETDFTTIKYQISGLYDDKESLNYVQLIDDDFLSKDRELASLGNDLKLTEEEKQQLLNAGISLEEIEEGLNNSIPDNEYVLNTIPEVKNLNSLRSTKSESCDSSVWTSYGHSASWSRNIFWLSADFSAYTKLTDNCDNPLSATEIKAKATLQTVKPYLDNNGALSHTKEAFNTSEVTVKHKTGISMDSSLNAPPEVNGCISEHSVKYGGWLDKTYKLD